MQYQQELAKINPNEMISKSVLQNEANCVRVYNKYLIKKIKSKLRAFNALFLYYKF